MNVVRKMGLQPEISGPATETSQCTNIVHIPNVRFLKICNNTAAQARSKAQPHRNIAQARRSYIQFGMMVNELFDLTMTNVHHDAKQNASHIDELAKYTAFR